MADSFCNSRYKRADAENRVIIKRMHEELVRTQATQVSVRFTGALLKGIAFSCFRRGSERRRRRRRIGSSSWSRDSWRCGHDHIWAEIGRQTDHDGDAVHFVWDRWLDLSSVWTAVCDTQDQCTQSFLAFNRYEWLFGEQTCGLPRCSCWGGPGRKSPAQS